MAVQVLAGTVIAHGGARVGVARGDLNVAKVDSGVEHRGHEGVRKHVRVHPGGVDATNRGKTDLLASSVEPDDVTVAGLRSLPGCRRQIAVLRQANMAPGRKAELATGAHERRGTLAFRERGDLVPIQVSACTFDPVPLASLELRRLGRGSAATGRSRASASNARVLASTPLPCRTASRQTSQDLLLSSGALGNVCPGSVFVVQGTGLQTAVQDADPADRELSEGGLVAGVRHCC